MEIVVRLEDRFSSSDSATEIVRVLDELTRYGQIVSYSFNPLTIRMSCFARDALDIVRFYRREGSGYIKDVYVETPFGGQFHPSRKRRIA
jgi:hypothetical protein